MSLAARREVLADVAAIHGRSLWQDARRRLLRNRAAVVSMIVLGADRGPRAARPLAQPAPLRRDLLGAHPGAAGLRACPLVRHRRQRPRPVRAHALRRPGLAHGRPPGDRGQPADRRHLGCGRRLFRRPRRQPHDALRRHHVLAAVHVLRDPADGRVRPPHLPDLRRDRRGRVADHGAHRARPDAVGEGQGVHRGGARGRRQKPPDHHPPRHPERARAGDRLRHPDRPPRHPDRIVPVVPRPRRPGAADQLGRPDRRGRRPDGIARPGS